MSIYPPTKTEVSYRDRQTVKIVTEKIFAENTLRWFYEDALGFKVFNYLLNNQIFSEIYGKYHDLINTKK